jgi:hypothetical protein
MADNGESKPAVTTVLPGQSPKVAAAPQPKAPAKATAAKSDAPPPDRMRRRVIWAAVGGYLGINFLMFLRFFFPLFSRALCTSRTPSSQLAFPPILTWVLTKGF